MFYCYINPLIRRSYLSTSHCCILYMALSRRLFVDASTCTFLVVGQLGNAVPLENLTTSPDLRRVSDSFRKVYSDFVSSIAHSPCFTSQETIVLNGEERCNPMCKSASEIHESSPERIVPHLGSKLIATKVCDLWESIKANIFARDVLVNIQISGLFCSMSSYKGLATAGVLRLGRKVSSEQGARSILGC